MALRDRIPLIGSRTAPYAGSAPTNPVEQTLGHTATASDPSAVRPRIGAPFGASGRANFYGLPQPDELNPKLIGPEGVRLLDEMYRTDAHVRRLVLAAWSPVVAGTWTLEPYGGEEASDADRNIADAVWWILTEQMRPSFTEHLYELGPVLLRNGFCAFEQIWGTCKYEGKTLLAPRKLDIRRPSSIWRWWQDDFGDLTHIGQILPNKPDVVIPASELVYYRLGAEGDNWQGTSLLRQAYKHWLIKDRLERIDMIGQERKAVGVPIVYHSSDIHPDTLDEVERAVASMHTSDVAYLMLPGRKMGVGGGQSLDGASEWLIDVIQFDSSAGDTIHDSLNYHQQAMSASFLTDFLELGHHQVGARATADIQQDPFITAINGALLPPLIPPLNRLIDRIVKMNWSATDGSPQLKLTLHDEASLSEISSYVVPLIQAGAMQTDPDLEDWLRDRAAMPPANADYRAQSEQARQQALEAQAQAQQQQPGAQPGQPGSQPAPQPAQQPAGKALSAAEPSARWFDRLLSQDRLREAFDGCRDHIQHAVGPQAILAARKLAHQAANGVPVTGAQPPADLERALTQHYSHMYELGRQTVRDELAKQRHALRTLDNPVVDTAAAAAAGMRRLERARHRGEHSARNIVNKITEVLGRAQITGLKDPQALQTAAETAAGGALRMEALANTTSMVNDGRHDMAASSGDVVGAYYTSVMDERTCDTCARDDTGTMLSPDDAVMLGPPNPGCDGQDRCRCALVWVLSTDPAALQAVL